MTNCAVGLPSGPKSAWTEPIISRMRSADRGCPPASREFPTSSQLSPTFLKNNLASWATSSLELVLPFLHQVFHPLDMELSDLYFEFHLTASGPFWTVGASTLSYLSSCPSCWGESFDLHKNRIDSSRSVTNLRIVIFSSSALSSGKSGNMMQWYSRDGTLVNRPISFIRTII